jgi:hypothetical protein
MNPSSRNPVFIAIVLLLFVAVPTVPAATADLAGHWDGAIVLPSMQLEINLDFTKQADGSWEGNISIPVQNIKDMALSDVKLDGVKVSFAIPGIPATQRLPAL